VTCKILILLGGTALAWFVLAIPARYLAGEESLLFSAVAAGLCGISATLTLVLVGLAGRSSPEHRLYALLAGTMIRMFGVLLVGFLLYQQVEYFRGQDAFLYWLLGFYLLTLALEKTLALSGWTATRREGTASTAT
jgi:hypothetical protein